MEKIFEQQADPDDLVLLQRGSDFAKRQVSRDERHGKSSARQQHREILHPTTIGEEFGLARKRETDFVHPRLVNGPGHNGLNFPAEGESGAFFEGVEGRVGRLGGRLT